jgi:hypothetical protein
MYSILTCYTFNVLVYKSAQKIAGEGSDGAMRLLLALKNERNFKVQVPLIVVNNSVHKALTKYNT